MPVCWKRVPGPSVCSAREPRGSTDSGVSHTRDGKIEIVAESGWSPATGNEHEIAVWFRASSGSVLECLLRERCRYCPVPIRFNGSLLSSPGPGILLGKSLVWGSGPDRLGQPSPPGAELDGAVWDCDRRPVLLSREFELEAFVPDPGFLGRGLQTTASIPECLVGPSRLILVQHGVSFEPIPLLDDFGCLVVMQAEEVPTDLSGLVAVDGDPRVARRLEWARFHLADLLALVERELAPSRALAPSGSFHYRSAEAIRARLTLLRRALRPEAPVARISELNREQRPGLLHPQPVRGSVSSVLDDEGQRSESPDASDERFVLMTLLGLMLIASLPILCFLWLPEPHRDPNFVPEPVVQHAPEAIPPEAHVPKPEAKHGASVPARSAPTVGESSVLSSQLSPWVAPCYREIHHAVASEKTGQLPVSSGDNL